MKRKKNRPLIILVVMLGTLSFWLVINNKKGTIKEALRDFAVQDTVSITRIILADNKSRISLERQPSGSWMVNGKFIARREAIQTLLYTIHKVDVKEPASKKKQDELIAALTHSSVKCEIYQGDKLVKAYYVGAETDDRLGTYMLLIDPGSMEPSAKPFVTYIPGFNGYLTTRYFTDEKKWRDRTVFRYHPDYIKSVKLEIPFNPGLGYELISEGRNKFEVRLLKEQKPLLTIDSTAVSQYLSYFQNLNFETFENRLNEKQTDSVRSSQPLNIITVTDKDGKSSTVKFFARAPERPGQKDINGKEMLYDQEHMNAVLNDNKELVVVKYYVFGKVMPPVEYFLKRN